MRRQSSPKGSEDMRFLIRGRVPTDKTNTLIQEGRFPQTFQSIMEDLQPEAAYFTDMDGARGFYFVVNAEEPSEMAAKTESLLQGLGAEIQIQFVWTPEDVQEAMPHSSKRHRNTAKREKATS